MWAPRDTKMPDAELFGSPHPDVPQHEMALDGAHSRRAEQTAKMDAQAVSSSRAVAMRALDVFSIWRMQAAAALARR
jgi:hypothetical protein